MKMSFEKRFPILLVVALLLGMLLPASASADVPPLRSGIVTDGGMFALLRDGTVRLIENEEIKMENYYDSGPFTGFESWTGITQLVKCNDTIAGLREDGTVAAVGQPDYVREIQTWDHIRELISLSGDHSMIAGLKEDGTVVLAGYDASAYMYEEGELSMFDTIKSWRNVSKLQVGVCAAGGYAAAIHYDGSVSYWGVYDVGWSGNAEQIVDIDCSGWGLIALREDGTCVVNGEDSWYREITDTWSDLKQVGCGDTLAIGLKKDGTFVATRDDLSEEFYALRDIDHFECSTYNMITAYRKDGTVEVFLHSGDSGNKEVKEWTDIETILAGYPLIVGLKTDGTPIATAGQFE